MLQVGVQFGYYVKVEIYSVWLTTCFCWPHHCIRRALIDQTNDPFSPTLCFLYWPNRCLEDAQQGGIKLSSTTVTPSHQQLALKGIMSLTPFNHPSQKLLLLDLSDMKLSNPLLKAGKVIFTTVSYNNEVHTSVKYCWKKCFTFFVLNLLPVNFIECPPSSSVLRENEKVPTISYPFFTFFVLNFKKALNFLIWSHRKIVPNSC